MRTDYRRGGVLTVDLPATCTITNKHVPSALVAGTATLCRTVILDACTLLRDDATDDMKDDLQTNTTTNC